MKKKFIKRLFIFILPIFVAFTLIEHEAEKTNCIYRDKKELLLAQKSEIEAVILGSSHAFYNVDPAYLSVPAFNLGFDEQSLKYSEYLYSYAHERLPDLRYVILSMSYFSFNFEIEDSEDDWRRFVYYNTFEYDEVPFKDIIALKKHSIIAQMGLKTTLDMIYDNYFTETNKRKVNNNGFWPLPFRETANHDKSAEVRARRYAGFTSHYEVNLERLIEMIEHAQNENIRVILFTAPAWKKYRKLLKQDQLERMIQTCESLAQQYQNVRYLNALSSPEFTAADFSDADHLNENGARKFAEMIDLLILEDNSL